MRNGLVAISLLALVLCLPQVAAGAWAVEIVDQGDPAEIDTGQYPSVGFAPLDPTRMCISYHDDTAGELQLACRYNTTGGPTAWQHETAEDPERPIGDYSSLVIDTAGIVHIAYRRGRDVASVLKHATWDGFEWTDETVDQQTQGVGHNISMQLDLQDGLHISHTKGWGSRTVKYSHWNGSDWTNQTVFKPNGEFYFTDTSVALIGDSPQIVYLGDGTDASLDLAWIAGRKWKARTLDDDPGERYSVAMAQDLGGNRHIVYAIFSDERTSHELKYLALDGDAAGPPLIASSPGTSYGYDHVSLAIDSHGIPHIGFYDGSGGNLKYTRPGPTGGAWEVETVDQIGNVGFYSSLALDVDDIPYIAYYDVGNGDLKLATKVDDSTCGSVEDSLSGECSDGIDNDCDGLPDCLDVADCAPSAHCKCGNNVCEPSEADNCASCPEDCFASIPAGSCGDGICQPTAAIPEDCLTCPDDCDGKLKGKKANQFCCGGSGLYGVDCSDSRCSTFPDACDEDNAEGADACCGDGDVEPDLEHPWTCGIDVCGDGTVGKSPELFLISYHLDWNGQTGITTLAAGATYNLYGTPNASPLTSDTPECRVDCHGNLYAYYHDVVSGNQPPEEVGELVDVEACSAGTCCSHAMDAGYNLECCLIP